MLGATPKSMSLYSQPFLSITSSAFVGEGGSLPFCILIIAHIRLFVKHFFNFLRKSWDLNPLGIASHFTAGTISPPIEKLFLFLEVMVGLVPPSQKLGRSCTALPPFPSRLLCLSLLTLYPYCITTWAICQGVFDNFFILFGGFGTDRR
jgi:hypothetical protein